MRTNVIKQFLHSHGTMIIERHSHDERIGYTLKIDIDGDKFTYLVTDVSELTAVARGCMLTDEILRRHDLPAINWAKENI